RIPSCPSLIEATFTTQRSSPEIGTDRAPHDMCAAAGPLPARRRVMAMKSTIGEWARRWVLGAAAGAVVLLALPDAAFAGQGDPPQGQRREVQGRRKAGEGARKKKECKRDAVEITRATGESESVLLTRCEGGAEPRAVEQLSLLLRPYSVPKPVALPVTPAA